MANVSALVDDLVRHDIPIQSFIIDDGWENQRTFVRVPADEGTEGNEGRGLWDFGSHPDLGDGGLESMVEMIRTKLSSVDTARATEVGVWMT